MPQKGFWSEFRSFAVKGNAFDLAVAVVIGNAFTAVVQSLAGDIISPVIGLVTNHIDFKTLMWQQGPLVIKYGAFLQTVFNFFLVSLFIFVVFKMLSTGRKKIFDRHEEVPPEQKKDDVRLLEEIRDLLRAKS
jgi:large conductance mechanosensitive channel